MSDREKRFQSLDAEIVSGADEEDLQRVGLSELYKQEERF